MMNADFELLLKRISPTLKRITYRLNGRFSFFNDEDLYQEAILHLWQLFNNNAVQDKTDSYILQGCYFHLKNYLRKMRPKARSVSLELLINDTEEGVLNETLLLEAAGSGQSTIDYLNDKMLADLIRNNGFTSREKRVLSFCAEGFTMREIGSRIGVSHVCVIKLMRKIKEKCRKYADPL